MSVEESKRKVARELEGRERGRVLVGMSGGVDSSVTLALLQEAGFECVGATMRLYDTVAPGSKTCCSVSDILDARAICATLGVPHEMLDARAEFEREVIEPFVTSYEAGLTPNPCVECNRRLKFGLFAAHAEELGCAYLATGHYARCVARDGRMRLLRGEHLAKDQSYVLHPASPNQLNHLLLPLGVLNKDEVRELADDYGLNVAHKGESQDICFVPNGDYAGFLEDRRGSAYPAGEIVDVQGTSLGVHAGLPRYTIGQRKGLGVAAGKRLYVVDKRPQSNTVVLGEAHDLRRGSCVVRDVVWHECPAAEMDAEACTRYQGRARPVRLFVRPEGNEVLVKATDEPFPSIAPGQACVFYQGDLVLGGGTIAR